MISIKTKQLMLLFVLCMLGGIDTKAQGKPGVFYSITGNGLKDTSWLFGTHHLVKDSYLNEIPGVKAAFDRSGAVVVEVVIDSAELPRVGQKAVLGNGQLSDFFDKPFTDSLDLVLKSSVGQGLVAFQRVKPIVLMLTMSVVQQMKDNAAVLGKYKGQALDVFFASEGKTKQKSILGLETLDQQMDLLFNGLPPQQQAAILKDYIRNKDAGARLGNELLRTYFDNDLTKIAMLYQASVQVSGELDYLVRKRNIAWMQQLPAILQRGSSFVAVGALHLAGEEGLVSQLRRLGYNVTAQNLQ